MSNRILFSGSRDAFINKWDLNTKEMVASINNAHEGWITGLAFANKDICKFILVEDKFMSYI